MEGHKPRRNKTAEDAENPVITEETVAPEDEVFMPKKVDMESFVPEPEDEIFKEVEEVPEEKLDETHEEIVAERVPKKKRQNKLEAAVYRGADEGEKEMRAEAAKAKLEKQLEPSKVEPSAAPEPEIIKDVSESEEVVSSEGTPKEWRDKLRGLIIGAKESVKNNVEEAKELFVQEKAYLTARSSELGEKIKAFDPKIEKSFRWLGEQYNKRSTREKILIGIALGLGAGVSATSISLVGALGLTASVGGLVAQRVAGLSSMFLKYEKSTQEGKWQKEKAMGKAMLHSAAMTAGMLLLVQEIKLGVDYRGHMVDANKEWLKHYWPGHTPNVPTTDVGGHATAASHNSPPTPHALDAHGEQVISVDAKAGHGYEYMVKKMWEQINEHRDQLPSPSKIPADSDLAKLYYAGPEDIDKIVHQIAADPNHHFFNTDGTSVQINPDQHLSILPDGQIHIENAATDYNLPIHAPEGAHMTPAYQPEAPVAEVPVTPTPVETSVTPTPEPPAQYIESPVVPVEAPAYSVESPVTPVEAPVHPVENQVSPVEAPVTPVEAPTPVPAETHTSVPETPKVETPVVHDSIVNKSFGIEVAKDTPHIYAGAGGKELLVYGGSPDKQLGVVEDYLKANPDKTGVFGTDPSGEHRILFKLLDGKLVPDNTPVLKTGFFGFLKSLFSGNAFVSAPKPEEFEKIIK